MVIIFPYPEIGKDKIDEKRKNILCDNNSKKYELNVLTNQRR